MKKSWILFFITLLFCLYFFLMERNLSENEIGNVVRFFLLEEPCEDILLKCRHKSFSKLKDTLLSYKKENSIPHFLSDEYLRNIGLTETLEGSFYSFESHKSKKIVAVSIRAGLGNQFFHYASAYALAKKLDAKLILFCKKIKPSKEPQLDSLARKISIDDIAFKSDAIIQLKNNNLFNERCFNVTDDNILSLNGDEADVYILGIGNSYYESFEYFKEYIADVKNILRPLGELRKTYLDYKEHIKSFNNSVAVHIRQGDFLNPEHEGFVMPIAYQIKAMEFFSRKYPDCYFFIFSDSPEKLSPLFLHLKNCKILSNGSLSNIEEFFLMIECKHLIAANSTFSTWVGFLKNDGDVIAPFPKRYNIDQSKTIYPKEWMILDPFSIHSSVEGIY